jgi:hypothetical protein
MPPRRCRRELRGGDRGPDSFVVGHLRQYRHIVDAINEHRPAAVGAADALLTVAVVKAMYVSAYLRPDVGRRRARRRLRRRLDHGREMRRWA